MVLSQQVTRYECCTLKVGTTPKETLRDKSDFIHRTYPGLMSQPNTARSRRQILPASTQRPLYPLRMAETLYVLASSLFGLRRTRVLNFLKFKADSTSCSPFACHLWCLNQQITSSKLDCTLSQAVRNCRRFLKITIVKNDDVIYCSRNHIVETMPVFEYGYCMRLTHRFIVYSRLNPVTR